MKWRFLKGLEYFYTQPVVP